ncbi:MAG: GAF domain-containing protein, partial [Armatimonadota bacterium]|nr:GAF domain-containing protein [Armatimonadota bacterium]
TGAWQATILDFITEGICLADDQGLILYTNPPFDKMFGGESGEMFGAPFTAPAGHRRDTDKLPAPDLLEKLSEDGSWRGERINRKKDGTPFITFLRVTPVEVEGNKCWLCVHYDNVRLDSQAREAAAEQRRRARAAALVADVAVALCEIAELPAMLERVAEALVEHLDAAFARVWTLNDEVNVLHLQASAGMYTHLDGPHSRVPVGAFKIGRIAQDRQPHITNEVIGDPEVGDQQWAQREGMVAFAGYPLVVTGKVVGVMALFSRHALADDTLFALDAVADIVAQGIERKRLEETLRLRAVELAEADQKKDVFLAMLSHELRNPLSAIRNAVQVLDRIGDPNETSIRMRAVVARQVNHLSRIVEDLLDVSRLTGGVVELRKESVSVQSVVADAVETSAATIERKGHT